MAGSKLRKLIAMFPDSTGLSNYTLQRNPALRWRIGLFVVFALSIFLYLPALKGVLVWDDLQLTTGAAPETHDLVSAFTHPFGNYYRPLTSATFAIENSIAHGQPLLYHVTNIALHSAASLLIVFLALEISGRRLAAIVAGLFFAAQPVQVGAVAWIGGRTDALSAFFLTVFLICLVRFQKRCRPGWLLGAIAAYFLATLSKEQCAVMVFAVPVSAYVFGGRKWRSILKQCAPFVLVLFVYALMWHTAAPKFHTTRNDFSETFTVALRTAAHYGSSFLFPNSPSLVTFTLENERAFTWIVLGGVFLTVGGLYLKEAWKVNRPMAFAAICSLLVYLPVSNFIPAPSFIVAPYRCAGAGVGVACLLGMCFVAAWDGRKWIGSALLGLNLLACIVVTWVGVHIWLDPMDLFARIAKNDPHFMIGVQLYSHELDNAGRPQESADVTNHLLAWLFNSDRWAEKIITNGTNSVDDGVKRRLKTNTGIPILVELGAFIASNGMSNARTGHFQEAAEATRAALVFDPKNAWVHFLYGRIILQSDRREALNQWALALQINPDYADCALALAHQKLKDGSFAEADQLLEHALTINEGSGFGWLDLARAKLAEHDVSGAMSAIQKAQTVQTKPPTALMDAVREQIQRVEPAPKH